MDTRIKKRFVGAVGAAVLIVIFLLIRGCSDDVSDVERYAIDMHEETDYVLEHPEGGNAVNITYSDIVEMDVKKKQAHINFQNPKRSCCSTRIELTIGDSVVASSGWLMPGCRLDKMKIKEDTDYVKKGTYKGQFIVRFYDAQNSAVQRIKTVIPVKIIVS